MASHVPKAVSFDQNTKYPQRSPSAAALKDLKEETKDLPPATVLAVSEILPDPYTSSLPALGVRGSAKPKTVQDTKVERPWQSKATDRTLDRMFPRPSTATDAADNVDDLSIEGSRPVSPS